MKRVFVLILGIAVLLHLSSCEKWRRGGDQTEITFDAVTYAPEVETKAYLYDDNSFGKIATVGGSDYGGYFHVDAYYQEPNAGSSLLIDEDVILYEENWRFYQPSEGGGEGKLITWYWPMKDSDYRLHFFAYAPRYKSGHSGNKLYQSYVSVNNGEYPPTFTVEIPGEGSVNDNLVEFVYAFTPEKKKGETPVGLVFQHPFAVISFNLIQAKVGLEIEELGFHEMYKRGEYSKNDENNLWSVKSWVARDTASLSIKNISTTVGQLGGTYLVLPQAKERAKFVFYITYLLDTNNDGVKEKHYKTANVGIDWESGKKYVYNLDLGSSLDGVYFTVSVEKWDKLYDHKIPVE